MSNTALVELATASHSFAPFLPARAVDGVSLPENHWVRSNIPASLAVDLDSIYLANRWVVRNLPVAGWASIDYANCDFLFIRRNGDLLYSLMEKITHW